MKVANTTRQLEIEAFKMRYWCMTRQTDRWNKIGKETRDTQLHMQIQYTHKLALKSLGKCSP